MGEVAHWPLVGDRGGEAGSGHLASPRMRRSEKASHFAFIRETNANRGPKRMPSGLPPLVN
jgi:hypothetical protein